MVGSLKRTEQFWMLLERHATCQTLMPKLTFACVLLSAPILGVVTPSLWTTCALTAAVVLRHIYEAYLSESLTAKL